MTNAEDVGDTGGPERSTAQRRLIGIILVFAVTNIAYRLVYTTGWARTGALYVGVPTVLAIGLTLLPRSRSTTGMLFKGALLALLLACVILPEGLICLLFVLPLVAIICALVGGTVDWWRRRHDSDGPALLAVGLPLAILSLEGVIGSPFDSRDQAGATIVVHASPAAVADALAAEPGFEAELPPFLAAGFNRPVDASGSGIDVGDHRVIDFVGGTHDDHPLRLFGLTGERSVEHHAAMHLTVTESGLGRVVFTVDHDETMLSRWADLDRAVVTWEPVDTGTTRVTWQLEYDRLLYPTAYFAPLQRYGMGQAAAYLLDAVIDEPLR